MDGLLIKPTSSIELGGYIYTEIVTGYSHTYEYNYNTNTYQLLYKDPMLHAMDYICLN